MPKAFKMSLTIFFQIKELFFPKDLKKFTHSFIFGCAGSSLLCTGSLQLWCTFSLQWLLLLQSMGLQAHRLNSCFYLALECGLSIVVHRLSCSKASRIFPDQGIKPLWPALVGRLLTTEDVHNFWMYQFLFQEFIIKKYLCKDLHIKILILASL